MGLAFRREIEWQAEKVRKLQSSTVFIEDDSLDGIDHDATKAPQVTTQELVMEHLESDGSRVWAAQSQADMEVWVGWAAAVLN